MKPWCHHRGTSVISYYCSVWWDVASRSRGSRKRSAAYTHLVIGQYPWRGGSISRSADCFHCSLSYRAMPEERPEPGRVGQVGAVFDSSRRRVRGYYSILLYRTASLEWWGLQGQSISNWQSFNWFRNIGTGVLPPLFSLGKWWNWLKSAFQILVQSCK